MNIIELTKITKLMCEMYKEQYENAIACGNLEKTQFVAGIIKGIEKLYTAISNSEQTKITAAAAARDSSKNPYDITTESEIFLASLSEYCSKHECLDDCDPADADWLEEWNNYMANHEEIITSIIELEEEDHE